jgi:hypothetical protein
MEAFKINQDFDAICGQTLNWKKVYGFATLPTDQTWLQSWSHEGRRVTEVKSIVTLGHQMTVSSHPSGQRDRIKKGKEAAQRLNNIFAPTEAKRRIAANKVIPMTCYGSAIEILPKTSSSEIARSLTKSVWGRNFQMRSPEMVRSMICTPTGTHPFWASIVSCFTDIARCAEKRPSIADTLRRVKTKKEGKPHLKSGPIANMEKAAKAMGYTLSDAITIANGNETIPIIGQQI